MNIISFPSVHYYLLQKGKKSAVASVEEYPSETDLHVLSGGRIWGVVSLGRPSKMTLEEFDKLFEEHRIRVVERKLFWPKAQVLCVQRIEKWKPFEESLIADAKCLGEVSGGFQPEMVQSAARLPKMLGSLGGIYLGMDGSVSSEGFDAPKIVEGVTCALGSFRGSQSGEDATLYDLVLVRRPLPQVEKIQENAPGYIEAVEGSETCSSCVFSSVDARFCNLYSFFWKPQYVCDSWEDAGFRNSAIVLLRLRVEEARVLADSLANLGDSEIVDLEEMHITLMFLGGVQEIAKYRDALSLALSQVVKGFPSMVGRVQGLGIFQGVSGGTRDVVYASYDCPELPRLREELMDAARGIGLKPLEDHGFTPHITVGYVLRGEGPKSVSDVEEIELIFDEIELSWGDTTESFPFVQARDASKEFGDMPFEIVEQDGKTCVVKIDDGEIIGPCYEGEDALDKAQQLLAALIINVTKWVNPRRSGFAIKEVQGEPWLVLWSSNAFIDRHNELIRTQALEEYVLEAERLEAKGFFNVWHIPGTEFAEKVWQAVPGRILVEAGPFLNDENGRSALEFLKEYPVGHPVIAPHGWGASLEFFYRDEDLVDNKEYVKLWVARTSLLPQVDAANLITRPIGLEGVEMTITTEQREAANAIFGDERAAEIISAAEETSETLESLLEFKQAAPQGDSSNAEKQGDELVDEVFDALEAIVAGVASREVRRAVYGILDGLVEANLADRGEEVLNVAESLEAEGIEPEIAASLREIGTTMVETKDVDADAAADSDPISEEAMFDRLQETIKTFLSGDMATAVEKALAPVIARITVVEESVREGTQSRQARELPRSVLADMRASVASRTKVKEGEKIGRQSPASSTRSPKSGAEYYYGAKPVTVGD